EESDRGERDQPAGNATAVIAAVRLRGGRRERRLLPGIRRSRAGLRAGLRLAGFRGPLLAGPGRGRGPRTRVDAAGRPAHPGPPPRRRGGPGLSGKAAPFTASSACPVTQTRVWSLEAE